MAQYKCDTRDIDFNLFEYLKIQDFKPEYDEADFRAILTEFEKFTANEIFPTRESRKFATAPTKEAPTA